MSALRLIGIGWWLQLKMRSRSAFDGALSIAYPLFFATSIFLIYRQHASASALVSAAVGSSVMGVWSAVATTASTALQQERRLGTLELLACSPRAFGSLIVPMTLSMATIGLYSLVATLLWGRFVFGIPISLQRPATFAVACVVTAAGVAALGFMLAVNAVRYRSAWALGTALELPVWLVCGFIVPTSMLPAWVQPVSWAIPITWGVNAIKKAATGGDAWLDIVACVGLSAFYFAAGALLATRLINQARRHATLALT